MKVLLFGSRGYLGGYLRQAFPEATASDADIADQAQVARTFDEVRPDIVINAAGKTGKPNVDWCEDHKLETVTSNVTGPLVLLQECLRRSIYLVHLGSGCLYEGDNGGKGFSENDPPNFSGSFYARTKAWSDQILQDFPVLQLRLRMPFDGTTQPRNLISKLKKYAKVLDEPNSLTYLPDFVEAAKKLIDKRKVGIYNIVNPGAISPYQIMQRYRQLIDPKHSFEHLSLADLPGVAKAGRSNCILATAKLESEGIVMKPVSEAVDEALKKLKMDNA